MNKKIIYSLLIFLIIIVSCTPIMAEGEPVTLQLEYGIANRSTSFQLGDTHPSDSANPSAFAQTFNSTTDIYVTSVRFGLYDADPAYAKLVVRISTVTGTAWSAPDETNIIATSAEVDVAAWLTEPVGWVDFEFSSWVHLSANTNYALYIVSKSGYWGSAPNSTYIGVDNTTPTDPGKCYGYINSAWALETYDLVYQIYGYSTLPATALPTGGINVDTSNPNEVFNAIIGYGVPVVITLLPALFLYIIGGRGKWPMLIGVAIGTGIGYLFGLVPVWLVFLIAVAEIGLAYSDVTSGNGMT